MNVKRGIITVGLALITIALLGSCDESTNAHIRIIEYSEGLTEYVVAESDIAYFVYIDLTVENYSSGSAREVACLVTATEMRSNTVLAETTVYFAGGGIIEPDEQATERFTLYNPEALELIIQYEEVTAEDGSTERVPLEPIVDLSFELSWEELYICSD